MDDNRSLPFERRHRRKATIPKRRELRLERLESRLALSGVEFTLQPSLSRVDGVEDAYAADLDEDNDLDILVSAPSRYGGVAWYENTCGAKSVHTGDLDGDGDLDLLSASEGDGIEWYENVDGRGAFALEQRVSTEAEEATSVFAAEMDGGGKVDVVAARAGARYWYAAPGSAVWYKNKATVARVTPPGDVNGDGRFDRSDTVGSWGGRHVDRSARGQANAPCGVEVSTGAPSNVVDYFIADRRARRPIVR